MTRTIDFHEHLAELQRLQNLRFNALVGAWNAFPLNQTLSARSYADMMSELAEYAEQFGAATQDIMDWMQHHRDLRAG